MMNGGILEGYQAVLGLGLTQHCDASTVHDGKALENLILLNFEFQYLNIRSIQITLAAQMSLLAISFYVCNGVILLKTAVFINGVTLIVTGDE